MTPEGCGDKEGILAQGPCWVPITRLVRQGVAWAFTGSGLGLLLTHPLLAYLFIFPSLGRPDHLPAWGVGLHCSPMQEFPCSCWLEVRGLLLGPCALFRGHSLSPHHLPERGGPF